MPIKYTYNFKCPVCELRVGDVVRYEPMKDSAFSTVIVQSINREKGTMTFFRPYGVHAGFTYTGGVICYTGVEEFRVSSTDQEVYHVYCRERMD